MLLMEKSFHPHDHVTNNYTLSTEVIADIIFSDCVYMHVFISICNLLWALNLF